MFLTDSTFRVSAVNLFRPLLLFISAQRDSNDWSRATSPVVQAASTENNQDIRGTYVPLVDLIMDLDVRVLLCVHGSTKSNKPIMILASRQSCSDLSVLTCSIPSL